MLRRKGAHRYLDLLPSHSCQHPSMIRSSAINSTSATADPRKALIVTWLEQFQELADAELRPASADASFRRYFRVANETLSRIVMDAPPEKEDCEPFIRISGQLVNMGINAPEVLATDLEQGFLLLADLGTRQYLDVLQDDPSLAEQLYRDAIDALCRMHARGGDYQSTLPPYDETLLRFELSLFHDWLCETHLGYRFDEAAEAAWTALCDELVANALEQPKVFVHRDYHSRNLMVRTQNNPGVIDFQDAVEGPYTYDLVSLLKDCYVKWPADRISAWRDYFYTHALSQDIEVSSQQFRRHFDLMGVQRHLKAAGIFARLNHRDGKPGYMHDIPRTLSYVQDLATDYPSLHAVGELITDVVLPGLEKSAS